MQNPRIAHAYETARVIAGNIARGRFLTPPPPGHVIIFTVDAAYDNHYGFALVRLDDILAARLVAPQATARDVAAIHAASETDMASEVRALSAALIAAVALDEAAVERLKLLAEGGAILTIVDDSSVAETEPDPCRFAITSVAESLATSLADEMSAVAAVKH